MMMPVAVVVVVVADEGLVTPRPRHRRWIRRVVV
jgi:hypothetical protein